jgi:putative ABC transport system substrate-binding protein
MTRVLSKVALLTLALLAAPRVAEAQLETVRRIGVLTGGSPPSHRAALTEALRERGYVEGRNLVIESRWAEGRPESLPGLAAELVRLKVDVIVTFATPATVAATAATATIPIIMTDVGDPVAGGLVASLARPGGNVTGLAAAGSETGRRVLELLKEAVPPMVRVSVVRDPMNPAHVRGYADLEAGATGLGVTLGLIDGRSGADLDRVFTVALQDRPEGLLVLPLHTTLRDLRRMADFAVQNRLPAVAVEALYAEAGFLLAYFSETGDRYRRLSAYIDKVLRGTWPGDLSIEPPANYHLAINLKTAKALGLTIPPAMLARADQIIE